MMQLNLLEDLPPTLAQGVERAGFTSLMDLLLHFPLRHEDWQTANAVADLQKGQVAMVEGEIVETKIVPIRGGRKHFIVYLRDSNNDTVGLRFFHATPGLRRMMEIGLQLRARGKANFTPRNGWEIAHPKFTTSSERKMRSIYPTVQGMTPPQLQRMIKAVLDSIALPDIIPPALADFEGSEWSLKEALQAAHAPAADGASPLEPNHAAWQRLRFEELVAHQVVLRNRYYSRRNSATPMVAPADWEAKLKDALPFALTGAQQRAIDEIKADLGRALPMRRLLQGDVGSGKTAVAAAACYLTILSDHTAAFMAPTEILAEQHYQSLSALFEKLNRHCELFTGSMTPKQRREAENRLRFGISSLAIGTHALFQGSTTLPRLGLAVIDEQHRFGVEQRQQLVGKGDGVHQLMMSATPIPRTLALSLYADMDVSVLDEKPAGRQPVRTIISDSAKRGELMARVADHIEKGGRVYWVCPLVEESDNSALGDVHSLAGQIKSAHPNLSVGIIHGRMKAAEKNEVMEAFRSGEHQVLAATTVIEVGVDVAQADVMVIESADRLGLSQLHQLRGRVGRGTKAGVCILLYQQPLSPEGQERLKIMRATDDGFEVAQRDLAMRGPGEWLGNRQSGMPSLRVARLGQDRPLADAARQAAEWLLKNDKRTGVRHVRRWLGERKKLGG